MAGRKKKYDSGTKYAYIFCGEVRREGKSHWTRPMFWRHWTHVYRSNRSMPNSFPKRKKDENQEVKTKSKEQKAENEAHLHE